MIGTVIGKLANYDGGTIPNTEQEIVDDEDAKGKKKEKVTTFFFPESMLHQCCHVV